MKHQTDPISSVLGPLAESAERVCREEVHPLRAAVLAARREYDEARILVGELERDFFASDASYERACERLDAAEDALEEARETLFGSDCPRAWVVSDQGGVFWTGSATSGEEAIRLADPTTDPKAYNDPSETFWYEVSAHCGETDEDVRETFQVDPREPDCVDGEVHDWKSPVDLVGGIEDNPGVSGNGGGVVVDEACVLCGCRRTTDTWATNPATDEQGLTSVEYEPDAYDVAILEDLAEKNDED